MIYFHIWIIEFICEIMGREVSLARRTKETDIKISLNLDGDGIWDLPRSLGFFSHILSQFVRFAKVNLSLSAVGDFYVDMHHTVEDVGIMLGKAIREAIGDGKGIMRFGDAFVPMDDALIGCVIDISGRGYYESNLPDIKAKIGEYDAELTDEFLRSVAINSGITMHILFFRGSNLHHIHEATFKAFGIAFYKAKAISNNINDIPSTKGVLDL